MVSEPLGDRNKVWFGAWVTIESEVGEEERWRIVGPDEFDVTQKKISCDSPLGRALLGKAIDTEVLLDTPSGNQRWILVEVSYSA